MAAKDLTPQANGGLESPAVGAFAITPSDVSELAYVTRALHVGTAGAVAVVMADGTEVTFGNLEAGWHPLRVKQVKTTGTAATDIVGVY